MKFSFHHTVRIRLWPKNKPAGLSGAQASEPPPWPVSFPPQTIYAFASSGFRKSQPPDCVPPREAAPDILHGSYLLEWQPLNQSLRTSCRLFSRLILSQKLEIHIVFRRFFDFISQKNSSPCCTHRLIQRLPGAISRFIAYVFWAYSAHTPA